MVVIKKNAVIFFVALLVANAFFVSRVAVCDEAVSRSVLDNGLIILTKESPPNDLVAIDINIKAGSALEGEYLGSGISHFVEHMVFKGTPSRKPGDIEREIKSYGGFINGSVSQDITNFHVILPSRYLKNALALLKDMLLNAAFEEGELKKERDVILKEINLDKDDPQRELFKLLNENAYIVHPYKYPPIGYKERFLALKRDDLLQFYNRMYVPNRTVITVVGSVGAKTAESLIENEFKDFRQPDYRIVGLALREPVQIGRRRAEKEEPINLSYLALGFHSTPLLSKDLFAMDVLSMILGRGDNSRLNRLLFKEKRLVHTIAAWNYTPRDPGLFVINAVLDSANLGPAEAVIMGEIEKLKEGMIGDQEVNTAKKMVLADYIFSRQTIEGQASDIGMAETLTGNYDFPDRYVKGIQGVTKDDIKRVADKYLADDNLTVIRLVPASLRTSAKRENAPAADSAPKEDTIQKETLPNGLRVLAREDKKTPTVSITVAMAGGLIAENEKNNGISNLTARMLLKGTKTRKEGEIEGAIERLGGTVTPFSGSNSFGLDISILKEDLDFALVLLKDILTGSIFPQEEIDKEKSLTFAMIKGEDDNIFQVASNNLRKEVFANSPYSLRTIGTESSAKAIRREDLVSFYGSYFAASNMVISVSGDIEPKAAIEKARDKFSDLKQKEIPAFPPKTERLDKIRTKALEMDKSESVLLLGFETVGNKDPDRYTLEVLSSVMSGYSGRLFTGLRDKLPLAYTLGCVQKQFIDTGYFVFYVATTKDKIPESRKALFEEIKNIRTNKITDEELTLAKREIETAHSIGRETNGFFSSNSALDELYGLGYGNLYKYKSEIERVTKDDIARVADKYLDPNAYAEVVVSSK